MKNILVIVEFLAVKIYLKRFTTKNIQILKIKINVQKG